MKIAVDCFKIEKPVAIRFRIPEAITESEAYDAVGRVITKAINAADWTFLWESDGGAGYYFCCVDTEDAEAVRSALTDIGCSDTMTFDPLPGVWVDQGSTGVLLQDDEGRWYFVFPTSID